MLKATINLNEAEFKSYENLDLEKDWKKVPVIRIYLKARNFDLSQIILVTKDIKNNKLEFFQASKNPVKCPAKSVVVIHPNPEILDQIVNSLKKEGHSVFGFKKVKEANARIITLNKNNTQIDHIVVPTNLEVSYNYTYKDYLNKAFPKHNVLTIDNNKYRDTMTIKELTKDNSNE